jgi:hypothetical protein
VTPSPTWKAIKYHNLTEMFRMSLIAHDGERTRSISARACSSTTATRATHEVVKSRRNGSG